MAQGLTAAIRAFIGLQTPLLEAPEPVEQGAVRRFAQAVMDPDPACTGADPVAFVRYGGAVAPPMFPVTLLHAPLDAPDLVDARSRDPGFDGLIDASAMGLPPLPLDQVPQLNAGAEFEMLRFARHGERIWIQSRYVDIHERELARGTVLFVVIETDFRDSSGALICRFRKTLIRG